MAEIAVQDFYRGKGGMIARVLRVDGTEILCKVVVNSDGTLGLKQPKGEWLIEPPPVPLRGQVALADEGEPS